MKNTTALFNQFKNEWRVCKSLVMVLETFSIEGVIPLLEKIEDYVSDGFFAAGFLSYEAAPAFNSANPMLFHKTTYRKIYQEARHSQAEGDDVILINENGEITETCIYNILLKRGEDYITPAAKCGLLPGTYRAWLLDNGLAREEIVKPRDLKSCDDIFVINSVRKSQKAVII